MCLSRLWYVVVGRVRSAVHFHAASKEIWRLIAAGKVGFVAVTADVSSNIDRSRIK